MPPKIPSKKFQASQKGANAIEDGENIGEYFKYFRTFTFNKPHGGVIIPRIWSLAPGAKTAPGEKTEDDEDYSLRINLHGVLSLPEEEKQHCVLFGSCNFSMGHC